MPKKTFTSTTYRSAIDYLLKDFGDRCAYSMQHLQRAGGKKCMEVDHHKPKGKNRNKYTNLFPATRHCNGAKGQTWPVARQLRSGIRFLNPCKEGDYGEVIFEDTSTHELYGTTPAAKFHILVCDLNAKHLVAEREDRSRILAVLRSTPATVTGPVPILRVTLEELRLQVDQMIPEIPDKPVVMSD